MSDLQWYSRANLFVHGVWQLFLGRCLMFIILLIAGLSPPLLVVLILIWLVAKNMHLQDLARMLEWPSLRGLVFL